MIKATFIVDKPSNSITMTLLGHAGAAAPGRDIICSAASILAYTVAQAARFMHADKKLRKKPHVKLSDGNALITVVPKKGAYAEALHTFFVAQVGYSLLAANYPRFVELNTEQFGVDI